MIFFCTFLSMALAMLPEVGKVYEKALSKTFPIIEKLSSSYYFNDDATTFPDDLWIKICEDLDGPSLWNMGLVNKHLGALLRSSTGFQRILMAKSGHEFLDLLASSELKLYAYHSKLFRDSPQWQTSWTQKQPNPKTLTIFAVCYELAVRLRDRAGDWDAFYYFLARFAGTSDFHVGTLDPAIIDDVWQGRTDAGDKRLPSVFGPQQYYYLPEPSAQKLFDRIDPKLVVRITFSSGPQHQCMFLPVLMSDYVLPSFRGELILSSSEKDCLRVIFRHSTKWLGPYFKRLVRALHLLGSEAAALPIQKFLHDLGFSWKKVVPKMDLTNNNFRAAFRLDRKSFGLICAVAWQWNVELRSEAHADDEFVQSTKQISAKNMRYLMCGNATLDHSQMKKVSLVDVNPRDLETLKRKRDDEDGDADEGDVKRRRQATTTTLQRPNLRQARDGSAQI